MCPAGNWLFLPGVMSPRGRHRSFLTVLLLTSVPYHTFWLLIVLLESVTIFFSKISSSTLNSSTSVVVAPRQVVYLGCTSGPGPLRMYSLKQQLVNLFFKWLHSPSKTIICMGHIVSVATTHLCHR